MRNSSSSSSGMSDLIPFIGFWEDENSLYIVIIFLKATFVFQNNLNEDGKQKARGLHLSLLSITRNNIRIPHSPHLLQVMDCNILSYCPGLLVIRRECLLNIIQLVIPLFV